MNFSEVFKQSDQLCKFSPNGDYLANVVQYRVIVRDVNTLQIQQLYSCVDTIQYIEWSPDSQFILCGLLNREIVQVWSLEQPEWKCKIDEGYAGLSSVQWSPDSRHILTTADFQLRVTVWSLVNKSVSYIKYPKQCQKGIDFSNTGRYMALIERRDFADYISIFACDVWKLVKHFQTDTEDVAGVRWSPDSRVLALWESPLRYKVLLYSIDGKCLGTFCAYDNALGIKHVTWSSTSQFLAIGSYDQKVRILNHVTWKTVAEFSHPSSITDKNVVAYREVETKLPTSSQDKPLPKSSLFKQNSKYEVVSPPLEVAVKDVDINAANPMFGVSAVHFSQDCRYLYTRNDNMPTVVWIWDVQKLCLAVVLVHNSPIICVSWDPRQSRLALCSDNNKLYVWSPSGSLSVTVPFEGCFRVSRLEWHPAGNAVLLMDREEMCVCYIATPSSVQLTDDSGAQDNS